MEIEVLKKSKVKRNIVIALIAILIISAIMLQFTRAKYRATDTVSLINGTVNYAPYDFKIMAMYQENDSGEYVEIESMPTSGYVINEEMSYCTIDNVNKDNEASLYTNADSEHVISGLKKNSKCYLYFDEQEQTCPVGATACNTILMGKSVQVRDNISTPLTDNTNGIIYKANDNDGTTFYFAGDTDENWVYFAGFYWRIIRVNGDGSVRMIYAGTDSNVTTGTDTEIGRAAFNINYNASYYVGLKYTVDEQYGTTTNSTILESLNSWYSSNLTSYASYIDQNAGFCNDRDIASGSNWSSNPTSPIFYGIFAGRSETFECTNPVNLFTVRGASKGNASLEYPIGLITVDEVFYAGGAYGSSNREYYLYTNLVYWTMSPALFGSDGRSYVFTVYSTGDVDDSIVVNSGSRSVRPVINLRADITLTGSGTTSSPYLVS